MREYRVHNLDTVDFEKSLTHAVLFCDLCTFVIKQTEQWISSPQSEQQMETLLDEVCLKIPVFSHSCVAFVNEYYPVFVQFLIGKFEPQHVCQELHACDVPHSILELHKVVTY